MAEAPCLPDHRPLPLAVDDDRPGTVINGEKALLALNWTS
jgi:hypothetical protein